MDDTTVLLENWKEARATINHLDKMMDGIRVRIFTIFGVVTSAAAALYYSAPDAYVMNLRLSSIVEISLLFLIIPSFIQNRLYHFWLYRSLITAINLEILIHEQLDEKRLGNISRKKIFLTHSLTDSDEPPTSYLNEVFGSKSSVVELTIFGIFIIASIILGYIFNLPTVNK